MNYTSHARFVKEKGGDMIEKVYNDISTILPIIDLKKYGMRIKTKEKNINYENIHEFLKEIGEFGEEYVYRKERDRLIKANSRFANKVTRNPALNHENGYDILSYTNDGDEIFIEVKTTTGDLEEPIYMSSNEYNLCKQLFQEGKNYQLYRVYRFSENIEDIKVKVFTAFEVLHLNREDILYKLNMI